MRAGRNHTRIIFDRQAATGDAAGGEVRGWSPQFTVWAEVHPLTGRETARGDQIVAEMDTRIRVRYDPRTKNIDATWRARNPETGAIYSIIRPPIDSDMRHRDLEFLCSTGVNPG